MLPPQDISIFLNNALKATHVLAEIESDAPLPDQVRDMPEQVSGHFVDLSGASAQEIQNAWKRVMILNATEVLYTFSFDPAAHTFVARKR